MSDGPEIEIVILPWPCLRQPDSPRYHLVRSNRWSLCGGLPLFWTNVLGDALLCLECATVAGREYP